MSRSSLNRKIKGILDLTPNDYIRLERLKKAAQLLQEGECKINEVCYMTGFNTPSYFTKCFQKQFGVKVTTGAIGTIFDCLDKYLYSISQYFAILDCHFISLFRLQ